MANSPHSLLTGTDLHEPKGVETADAGQIYIADGAGSGAWAGTGAFNSFGGALVHAQQVGTATALTGPGAAMVLTTLTTNEVSGASMASGIITLPAGTYYVEAEIAYRLQVDAEIYAALRNQTTSTVLVRGLATYWTYDTFVRSIGVNGAGNVTSAAYANPSYGTLTVKGRFTLASSTPVALYGIGAASGIVVTPTTVSAQALIWKVA